MNIVSYNLHGLGSSVKRKSFSALVRKEGFELCFFKRIKWCMLQIDLFSNYGVEHTWSGILNLLVLVRGALLFCGKNDCSLLVSAFRGKVL